jgi:hypothetical protein
VLAFRQHQPCAENHLGHGRQNPLDLVEGIFTLGQYRKTSRITIFFLLGLIGVLSLRNQGYSRVWLIYVAHPVIKLGRTITLQGKLASTFAVFRDFIYEKSNM